MKITITAPSGLEGVTKRELYSLLKVESKSINGRLSFEGGIEEVAKCNYFLRTASRVFITIGEFKANNFDDLFNGVLNLDFETYISKNGKINVYGSCIESKLMSTKACASIIKKAIVNRLSAFYNSELLESEERYKIEFVIRHDYVIISLDTSGEGLHKRGYRKDLVGDAPLKENVASALISLTVWNKEKQLADLFCGSGTIPIEAVLTARNIAPGKFRDFDFLHYKNFDTSFFEKLKEDALSLENDGKDLKITAFDIDENQLRFAKKHAENAGVLENIHFQCLDMRNFSSQNRHGVIISNPPYGERLSNGKEIVKLYRDFVNVYKNLKDWSFYLLTSMSNFEDVVHIKANKNRKIYNGKLECYFYSVLGNPPPKTKKIFEK